MKLTPDALAACKQLRLEAEREHVKSDGSYCVRAVAATYVSKLTDLRRFGQPWVDEYLASLMVIGAQEKLRDDRRKAEPGFTRRGVKLPDSVATTDAHGNAIRVPFLALSRDGLTSYRRTLADKAYAGRRSVREQERQLRELDRILAVMRGNKRLRSVGAALDLMERQAA